MKTNVSALIFLGFVLTGCAGYSNVDAGKTASIGDGVTIQPQIQWASAAGPGISGTVWTVDGLGLNELRFMTGIRPGEPLLEVAGVKNADLVPYQNSMLPDDVSEMTVSTLAMMGYSQSRSSNLRPSPFGDAQGFRFDLSTSKDGLDVKGAALGAQRGGKLDLIVFLAPAEYYFERYESTVEKVFSSVSLQSK